MMLVSTVGAVGTRQWACIPTLCWASVSTVIGFASSWAACYSISDSGNLNTATSGFLGKFSFFAFGKDLTQLVTPMFWAALTSTPCWPVMKNAVPLLALISVISWLAVTLYHLTPLCFPHQPSTLSSIPNWLTFYITQFVCTNPSTTRTFRPLRPLCKFTVFSFTSPSIEFVLTHALTFRVA